MCWQVLFVVLSSKTAALQEEGERFQFNGVCPGRGGEPVCIHGLEFTDKRDAVANAVAWWDIKYAEPLFWVTSFETAEEAHYWYRKRFRIEVFFEVQVLGGQYFLKTMNDIIRQFFLIIFKNKT